MHKFKKIYFPILNSVLNAVNNDSDLPDFKLSTYFQRKYGKDILKNGVYKVECTNCKSVFYVDKVIQKHILYMFAHTKSNISNLVECNTTRTH